MDNSTLERMNHLHNVGHVAQYEEPPRADFATLKRGCTDICAINRTDEQGYTYNCTNCAVALEMVWRGYDVKARPMPDGSNVGDVRRFFQGGTLEQVKLSGISEYALSVQKTGLDMYVQICNKKRKHKGYKANHDLYRWRKWKQFVGLMDEYVFALYADIGSAQGELIDKLRLGIYGKRGIIITGIMHDAMLRTNVFHAFNYKVEDGTVQFFDAQDAIKDDGVRDLPIILDPRDVYILRTDNLELAPSVVEAVWC